MYIATLVPDRASDTLIIQHSPQLIDFINFIVVPFSYQFHQMFKCGKYCSLIGLKSDGSAHNDMTFYEKHTNLPRAHRQETRHVLDFNI